MTDNMISVRYSFYLRVLFKGTEIFLLFLMGLSEISRIKGGIKSCMYEGTLGVLTLYMKESLFCFLFCDRIVHQHSLYRFSNDTDLVNPVTMGYAKF